ncbi:alpha/beta hydrolase [Kordiimonas laminariae]|uniref:alpha/beta hydrolase n=1 Tax=Kordiimonas laminariae TaxID=2917717 RepID=UPI001FF5096A|nr:hypothetical protein [Kordiimonas laminariae]
MLKIFTLACLLVGSAIIAPNINAGDATKRSEINIGHTVHFKSDIMDDTRELNIWVPPAYKENETYGVLYLLDGGLKQDFQHIAGLGHLGALSWTYEKLIIVGIETKDRRAELTPPAEVKRYRDEFPTSGQAAKFRAFITDEVMPFVEKNYPVNGKKTLMGESLAGLFVTDTFLKAPEMFDDYIAISPSLWWDDQRLGRNAPALLGEHSKQDRRLFIAMANEGLAMQAGLDKLVAALKNNPPHGLTWRYDDLSETETHATIYHDAALSALRWLYALPPYPEGKIPWYLEVPDAKE